MVTPRRRGERRQRGARHMEEDGRRRMGRGWRPSMKQEVTERMVEDKLREVVTEQQDLGLDVITDGEVPRENYYLHFIRNGVRGIDLDVLSDKVRLEW